jgi:simple sugar transport system permease protein
MRQVFGMNLDQMSLWKGKLRIEKRVSPSRWINSLSPVFAILFALLIGGLLPVIIGMNPLDVYRSMLEGILRSRVGATEVLVRFAPLLLTGLAVAVPLNANFFNIGAEGQFHVGAIAAFWAAGLVPNLPAWAMIPVLMAAAFSAGALWGLIPALLKNKFEINEIVTTLMFNYIGIFWLFHLIHGPWRQKDFFYPETPPLPDAAMLLRIPGTRVHLGLVFGLVAAVVCFFILKKTIFGYELRMAGANPDAARASGINVGRNIALVMILGGGLAGLGGMAELSGIIGRLKAEISLNYGYTAISVALLARMDPLRTIGSALTLSILFISGLYVQRALQLPFSLTDVIIGMVVILLLLGRFFAEYKLVLIRKP